MANAGTVTVDFAASTAAFTAELKRVENSLRGVETNLKGLNRVADVALRAFSGVLLANFAKQAFAAADATATAAERAGIAVETFSRLQFAAGQTDVEMGALTTGVQKFQVALSNASTGGRAAQEVFARFGLEAQRLASLEIESQLGEVAQAFQRITNPADRTRFAVELFGRSAGPQLVPLLAQGREGIEQLTAEADRLGITLRAGTVLGIDEADKALKRFIATANAAAGDVLGRLALVVSPPTDEAGKLAVQIAALERERAAVIKGLEAGAGGKFPEYLQQLNTQLETLKSRLSTVNTIGQSGGGFGSNLLPLPWLDRLREIDLAPIQAMKIEIDELALAYARLNQATVDLRIERFTEVNDVVGNAFIESQQQIEQQISANLMVELEARNAAEENAAAYRVALNQQAEQEIAQAKATTVNLALGLLQALGTKNKAFAIASIVLEKAIAIQRLLFHNQVASEIAFASQLIPGDPSSLARAAAAKAAVLAQGKLSALLVAATGAVQIADRLSSNPSPIGTAVNPIFTATPGETEQVGATSRSVTQIVFNGPLFNSEETRQYILDTIKEAVNDRDVVVISPSSRQAQDIREQP